jgi:hypothetical protein
VVSNSGSLHPGSEAAIQHGRYNYFLKGEEGDYLCSYGKKPPTFEYPTLHNGLCENYLEDIADGSVDLLIDDPPYGTTKAQWDNEPEWGDMADEYRRVMADDATLVIFGKQH